MYTAAGGTRLGVGAVLAAAFSLAFAAGDGAPPAGFAEAEKLVQGCIPCHGRDGVGIEPGIPSIGGQNAPYLLEELQDFRSKSRPSVVMGPIADALNEDDLQTIAGYFAALPYTRRPQTVDTAKAASGRDAYERICKLCHPRDGKHTAYADYPILAGQDLAYMQKTLADILAETRKANSLMLELVRLAPAERLDEALHFFAAQEIQPGEVNGAQFGAPTTRKRRFRPAKNP